MLDKVPTQDHRAHSPHLIVRWGVGGGEVGSWSHFYSGAQLDSIASEPRGEGGQNFVSRPSRSGDIVVVRRR